MPFLHNESKMLSVQLVMQLFSCPIIKLPQALHASQAPLNHVTLSHSVLEGMDRRVVVAQSVGIISLTFRYSSFDITISTVSTKRNASECFCRFSMSRFGSIAQALIRNERKNLRTKVFLET